MAIEVDTLSVLELAAFRQQARAHRLIDVREPDELAICRIDGALHIPMREVLGRLAELPRDMPLVVLCHHGMRSLQVTRFLRQAGFANAVNLAGGIDAWSAEIDPTVTRY